MMSWRSTLPMQDATMFKPEVGFDAADNFCDIACFAVHDGALGFFGACDYAFDPCVEEFGFAGIPH
jgi:hypothetical protein